MWLIGLVAVALTSFAIGYLVPRWLTVAVVAAVGSILVVVGWANDAFRNEQGPSETIFAGAALLLVLLLVALAAAGVALGRRRRAKTAPPGGAVVR